MEDSEGLVVDFKNTVIMLTSNVGTEAIIEACGDHSQVPDTETLVELVRPVLLKHFKPAFLGRLVIVPYYPLNDEVIRRIIELKLDRIRERFAENHRVVFEYSDELVAAIAARCTEVDTAPATWTICLPRRCCRRFPQSCWPGWPPGRSARGSAPVLMRTVLSTGSSRCWKKSPGRLPNQGLRPRCNGRCREGCRPGINPSPSRIFCKSKKINQS